MSADQKATAAPAAVHAGPVAEPGKAKAKSKTPQFTAHRTVALERHLWFTDLQGRSRAAAGPATPAAAGAAAGPPQRDVEDVCVTLREYDTAATVRGAAALVDATPRAGLSAAMAAAHLVAKLRLPVVADFVSSEFPVSVSIVRGEIANSVRLHGDARVCVLVSDVKFAASSTGDAVVRLLAAHVTDFCSRYGIAQLITIDGKGKQTAGAGRSAGGGGGSGGGGGGGGGDDDDDDDDDAGDGSVEVDLDALGDGEDGDDGGDDSAGTTRPLGTARVRVQPTGGSGSGSGKGGSGSGSGAKAPTHAHHKSEGKEKDPPKLSANAKDKAKGKGKGADKKSSKGDGDGESDESDSDSDSDSSDSSESDSDADAEGKGDSKQTGAKGDAKAQGKGKGKGSGKGQDKAKEKERSDRILFVTNDSALALRLRSAEFKPAPVTDAAVSAYTPKPAAATGAAAEAAAAATAGMSVRLRAWKDGTVRGLTGAVLECAPVTALRVVGLFAAGGTKSLTDVRLSVELVKAVVALCGLQLGTAGASGGGIRVKSLAKAARRIERKVRSAVKELTDQHTKSKRVMQSMYG